MKKKEKNDYTVLKYTWGNDIIFMRNVTITGMFSRAEVIIECGSS